MPKIAIIEDDAAVNESHRQMLAFLPDAEIHQAYSLEEARRVITPGGFDLLILDIDLGGSDGQKAGLELLSEFGKEMTSIVVSGVAETNLHQISLRLKAFEFIRKPADPLDFQNKVRHALAFGGTAAGHAAEQGHLFPKGLTVDPSRPPNILWRGKPVSLTLTELTIVHTLIASIGETVDYSELQELMKSAVSPRALSSHMVNLRKKFRETDKTFNRIKTAAGDGFRWKSENER